MGKSIIQQMQENHAEHKIAMFRVKQQLPYEAKIRYAELRARQFYNATYCFLSVGGLDSLTLYYFLKRIGIDVPAVSVSALEDKSIQRIHKELGIRRLKPLMKKPDVIRKYGYPVISKETASKIAHLQNPTEDNKTVRHAIITGETGEYGGFRKDTRMKMSNKWLRLFGGPENEREGTNYQTAPFPVSDKCCYYLKEKPCDDYAKEEGRYPFMGLMASEGGRRQKTLMQNGCNYFGKTTTRSAPFAIFDRQDLLQLALDLHVPVPEVYGEIVRDPNGKLRTTLAQRTGCSMCGFGIHFEKRPHRFDRLRLKNPKEWRFWMYTMGWGAVLDYIGIAWEDEIDIYEQLAMVI